MLIWGQIMFWLSYFTFFLLYEKSYMSWKGAFFQSSKFFIINSTLVYVHMYLLLPLLIHKKQYLKYVLLLISLITALVYTELSAERMYHTNPRQLKYINDTPHLVYLIGMDIIVIMLRITFCVPKFYYHLRRPQLISFPASYLHK